MILFAETFDAIARIEELGDLTSQHLQTVRALFESGNTDIANIMIFETLSYARHLVDPKQKLFLLRQIGSQFAAMSRFAVAFSLVEEIDLLLLSPPALVSSAFVQDLEEQKDALLREIAIQQAQEGSVDTALKTIERISDFDEYENTLTTILLREDCPETVLEWIEKLETPERRFAVWKHAASLQRAVGLPENSFDTIRRAAEIALREMGDSARKDAALRQIIDYHLKGSADEDSLDEVVAAIQKSPERCLAFLSLAAHHYGSHETEKAFSRIEAALEESKLIEERRGKIAVLKQIGWTLAFCDREKESKEHYRIAIQEASRETNAYSRMRFFSEIASSIADSGQRGPAAKLYRQAVATALEVEEVFLRCYYLREIAESMVRDDFSEEAIETIEQIVDPDEQETVVYYQKSLAFSRTAQILRERGETTVQDEELLNRALRLAREVTDPISQAEAFRKIAELRETRDEP